MYTNLPKPALYADARALSLCGQPMEIEPSFCFGTGYVCYALAVVISVAWWVLIGISFHGHRFFWWIGVSAAILTALQPYLMRLPRPSGSPFL